MREIKFRAWDGKELTAPFLLQDIPALTMAQLSHGENVILEQYTGLKDKNGKDIYEGDIVQFKLTDSHDYNCDYDFEKWHDTPIGAAIKWNEDACGFRAAFPARFKVVVSMFEIAGNVHDNPELLTPLTGERFNMEPNTKQPDELKADAANEQATEQAPAPTAGEGLESASMDKAMEVDSEEGSTEG